YLKSVQPPSLPSFPTRRSSDLAYLALLIRVLLRQGETAEAQRQLRTLQQKDPDGLATAEMTARLKKTQGQADEAAAVLTRFARRDPEEHTSELQSRSELVCRLL